MNPQYLEFAVILFLPLLVVAVLALVVLSLIDPAVRRGRFFPVAFILVYLGLVGVATHVVPGGLDREILDKYGMNERQLDRALRQHRALAPAFEKLDFDVRIIGSALKTYAEKLELERLLHGSWCYYSDAKDDTGKKVRAAMGDVAIERDHVTNQLVMVGSYGSHYFHTQRLFMDAQGVTYDWVSKDTFATTSSQSEATTNGQTFLTFEGENPQTGLKRKLKGFYWLRQSNGLLATGDIWMVRRGQKASKDMAKPLASCEAILKREGIL